VRGAARTAATRFAVGCAALLTAASCGRTRGTKASDAGLDASGFVWPFPNIPSQSSAPLRKGMVLIPPGTVLAGTPADRVPRIADEELAGEPTSLHGFYIDEYAYPDEPGAIPKTGVSQGEAAQLCAAQDKRLCTELEWERACKGPVNTTYEYGDTYRPSECATGTSGRLSPSGMVVSCKSAFGVHDMHGGPREWTSSPWTRGSAVGQAPLATLRGGDGEAGEVVARCANGSGRPVASRKPDAGFRCCAGEPNAAEINFAIVRGKTLDPQPLEAPIVEKVRASVAKSTPKELTGTPPWRIDRLWLWHPIGNEELLLASVCAHEREHLVCGVGVFRTGSEPIRMVILAPSGWWMPVVKTDYNGRDLWVNGGDNRSSFSTRLSYLWGRIVVGDPERHLPAPPP
jgi:formylglycine-generating enzyme